MMTKAEKLQSLIDDVDKMDCEFRKFMRQIGFQTSMNKGQPLSLSSLVSQAKMKLQMHKKLMEEYDETQS